MNQRQYITIENVKNNNLYQFFVPLNVSYDDAILAAEEIVAALKESARVQREKMASQEVKPEEA